MFISDTHEYSLIFCIDNDAPHEYLNRWKKIKFDCEEGDNKYIIEKMKTYCTLKQNKIMPYLQREEGGIGGDNNAVNKQIRFFRLYQNGINYKDIVLDQIINTNTEKWSYEELDDFIYALTKTFNYFVKAKCVNGALKMLKHTVNFE